MEDRTNPSQIAELEKQINNLPIGSISTKTINGHTYYYHRWYEDKKKKEKYIPQNQVAHMQDEIRKRKELERELKRLLQESPRQGRKSRKDGYSFITNIHLGEELKAYSASVRGYKKRECYKTLHDYVYGNTYDKVFILYGLRRTGKTTLIRQIIAEMGEAEVRKTAFIQATSHNMLADINKDLKHLEEGGYKYVFIDEITLMDDFIEGAALLSDIFAASGMKIVLSGTDSLGFLFTEDEQLYDRSIMLHTTFIPYREFENVLGIKGIDEYIRYGGTMSLGGVNYNKDSTFASKTSADEYVDTAIARNIQHSLKRYQYEGHFRNLYDLYVNNELTSAINRVVEDMNHRFTLEVLERDFHSSDLTLSANNLRKDQNNPTDILDRVDVEAVTKRLCSILEIRNKEERKVSLEDVHAIEIQEYLQLLDLTKEIDIVSMSNLNKKQRRSVITQPGLRYAQADALIKSLLMDERFKDLSISQRNFITDRILNEIKGRMMEDIILLETKLSEQNKEVFILHFPIAEFDMVVFDPQTSSCRIYEIKHSDKITPQQYRHLIDEEKCRQTEHRYGKILGKYVLYRGANKKVEEIQYMNVEEYLKGLGNTVTL